MAKWYRIQLTPRRPGFDFRPGLSINNQHLKNEWNNNIKINNHNDNAFISLFFKKYQILVTSKFVLLMMSNNEFKIKSIELNCNRIFQQKRTIICPLNKNAIYHLVNCGCQELFLCNALKRFMIIGICTCLQFFFYSH